MASGFSAFGASTQSSLMNLSRAAALVVGLVAGTSAASSRQRSTVQRLEQQLHEKDAAIAALELEKKKHTDGSAASTGDPVQDWLQSIS